MGLESVAPRKVLVGDQFSLKCSASIYNFEEASIQWYKETLSKETPITEDTDNFELLTDSTDLSFTKEIRFKAVQLRDKGRYLCRVKAKAEDHQLEEQLTWSSDNYYERISDLYRRHNQEQNDFKEKFVDLDVMALEPPILVETNLSFGEKKSTIVVNKPGDGIELRCRAGGRPKPEVLWSLNGQNLNITGNMSRIQLSEGGQILRVTYVTNHDEGLYECRAKNEVGMVRATGFVQLKASADRDVLYQNISIPVIIAVVIAILLVVLLVLIAKLCYSRQRKRVWKAPPTPPTPRLTQYELPQEEDDDDCRMTLTSTNRDGSSSPHTGHGSVLGVGSTPPVVCGSVLNGYAPYMPSDQFLCPCHAHNTCQSAAMPNCSLCDFPMQSMPMHTMTLKRFQPYGVGTGGGTLRIQQQHPETNLQPRSQSVSPPRLSAEF